MNKFEKVKKELEELTHDTNNFITITNKIDSRIIVNMLYKMLLLNIEDISYKILNEVIKDNIDQKKEE